jgi:hypothetical protein
MKRFIVELLATEELEKRAVLTVEAPNDVTEEELESVDTEVFDALVNELGIDWEVESVSGPYIQHGGISADLFVGAEKADAIMRRDRAGRITVRPTPDPKK